MKFMQKLTYIKIGKIDPETATLAIGDDTHLILKFQSVCIFYLHL